MEYRRTNLALLVLVPVAVVTGLLSNAIGIDWILDPTTVHAVVALAVIVLTPWKSVIVRRGLKRPKRSNWVSIGLLGAILLTVVSGLLHATGLTDRVGPLTIMQVHIGCGLLGLVLVFVHYRSHPVRPHRSDADRRAFLQAAGTVGLATAALLAWEGSVRALALPGSRRRFTGSHEEGSHQPDRMPVTQWLDDRVQHLDVGSWHVSVDGRLASMVDLASLPTDDVTATLDCTGGWYSEQVWRGVRLDRLVDVAGRRSFEVRSATGYARRFPASDAGRMWLAFSVGGEQLSAGHGFPARIVAPDRRGFWWVKWVTSITPSDTPWWIQLPFPAT